MKLVLLNKEKIEIGNRCTWCFSSDRGISSPNQMGIVSTMSVNQNCDPVEILTKHTGDSNFFMAGKKLIPVRNVVYIEE